MKIAVAPMAIRGRELDGSASFAAVAGDEFLHLDLLKLLMDVGADTFFRNMVIWDTEMGATPTLQVPSAATSSSSLMPLGIQGRAPRPALLQHNPAGRLSTFDVIVRKLLASARSAECGGLPAWRIVEGAHPPILDMQGAAVEDVEVADLQGMVARSFLCTRRVGDMEVVTIQPDAVLWNPRANVFEGTQSLTVPIAGRAVMDLSKMSALVLLHASGWSPGAHALEPYYPGGTKKYEFAISRAKAYFCALVQAEQIFDRFPMAAGTLPAIIHGMPDAYYRFLLSRNTLDLGKLQAMLDNATDVKAVVDTEEFKKLVLADDASGEAPRLALADREDLTAMRRIAVSALHGIPHSHVDISKRKFAIVDGERITVYFDNCSHQSGKPRIYGACRERTRHHGCFKYKFLHQFPSEEYATAWIALWVQYAVGKPELSKADHLRYDPTPEDVALVLPTVGDVLLAIGDG